MKVLPTPHKNKKRFGATFCDQGGELHEISIGE